MNVLMTLNCYGYLKTKLYWIAFNSDNNKWILTLINYKTTCFGSECVIKRYNTNGVSIRGIFCDHIFYTICCIYSQKWVLFRFKADLNESVTKMFNSVQDLSITEPINTIGSLIDCTQTFAIDLSDKRYQLDNKFNEYTE